MRQGRYLLAGLFALLMACAPVREATAQQILRDAETENFLREITDPILVAAGLNPNSVSIYLLGDDTLNAFVAGGQNIFIHSGLILAMDNVNQIKGVIAHETGHISGGHLRRMGEGASRAGSIGLASMLLGAAAIAAGAPDAGLGLILGGQTAAQRSFLAFSRVQESAADQAGLQFLTDTGTSGQGLLEFFDKIRDQELLLAINQDPYVRTHPLTSDRISRLNAAARESPHFNKPPDPEHERLFQRIKAKLAGFINRPDVTYRLYPGDSALERYARIYAYNKDLQWDRAIKLGKGLVEENPEDPYFNEITGQMLMENGRVEESLPYYERANEHAPNEPLIMTIYAQALVALERPDYDARAEKILEQAIRIERENAFAWRTLGTVYSRQGKEALTSLATAEYFALQGRFGDAVMHARRAAEEFETGTPEWIRAQDILAYAETQAGGRGGQVRRR